MLITPTDPASVAAKTCDAFSSTKYGTRCSPTPPLTSDRAAIDSDRYQKLDVRSASPAVKSCDKSGIRRRAAPSLPGSGATPSGIYPYGSGLCRISDAIGIPTITMNAPITTADVRHSYCAISQPIAGTKNPPSPTPDHIIPKANPRLRLNQLATDAVIGVLIPRLLPSVIAKMYTTKKPSSELTRLIRI